MSFYQKTTSKKPVFPLQFLEYQNDLPMNRFSPNHIPQKSLFYSYDNLFPLRLLLHLFPIKAFLQNILGFYALQELYLS